MAAKSAKATELLVETPDYQDAEIVISSTTAQPRAVREGVIEKVDHVETVTSANITRTAVPGMS